MISHEIILMKNIWIFSYDTLFIEIKQINDIAFFYFLKDYFVICHSLLVKVNPINAFVFLKKKNERFIRIIS